MPSGWERLLPLAPGKGNVAMSGALTESCLRNRANRSGLRKTHRKAWVGAWKGQIPQIATGSTKARIWSFSMRVWNRQVCSLGHPEGAAHAKTPASRPAVRNSGCAGLGFTSPRSASGRRVLVRGANHVPGKGHSSSLRAGSRIEGVVRCRGNVPGSVPKPSGLTQSVSEVYLVHSP